MALPRLQTDSASLLLIDLQERTIDRTGAPDRLIHNAATMIRVFDHLGLPTLATEFLPGRYGRTVDAITCHLPDPSARVERSCVGADAGGVLENELARNRRAHVLIAGAAASCGVLQVGLDLLSAGFIVWILADAIDDTNSAACGIAQDHLQRAGAWVTTVRSAAWALLDPTDTPTLDGIAPLLDHLIL